MNWIKLEKVEDLEKIKTLSNEQPILIFKHSTRCSISSMALSRLERSWKTTEVTPYLLDLIQFRNISNEIIDFFKVPHESPQALLIKDGKCVYNASHMNISYPDIIAQ